MIEAKNIDHRWWLGDKRTRASRILESCAFIADRESWRFADLLTSWRLYDGRKWGSLRRMGRQRRWYESSDELMRYNVVKSVTDTITAKLVKSQPAPEFVTNGADYKQRRATKKRNKFAKGVLHASGFYAAMPDFVREGVATGTSALKFCEEGKTIRCERALTWELHVPPWESERGTPKTLFQRTLVDRQALLDRFGRGDGKTERVAAIQAAKGAAKVSVDPSIGTYDRDMDGADMIEVVEAWHIGNEDDPGMHAIAISDALLLEERWTAKRWPFAFFRWETPAQGFWGRGLALTLVGMQYEINSLLQSIQANTKLHASPTTYLDSQAAVVEEQLTNEPGNVVRLTPGSAPPVRMVAPIMPAEVYTQVQERIRWAYELAGVSQLSASSTKPAGLDAAVALREFHDIESERFIVPGRRVEDACIQAAHVCIDIANDLRGYEVDTMERKTNRRVKWSDLRLAEEDFTLQCFPVNMLPQTPAARKQAVQEYMAAGMISPEKARDLLDMPDLEEDATLTSASLDYVRKQVEMILDEEGFEPMEPRVNLEPAVAYAQAVYLKERADGAPEHILEQLRKYIDQGMDLLMKAREAAQPAPPAAPQPMAPAGTPPAMAAA